MHRSSPRQKRTSAHCCGIVLLMVITAMASVEASSIIRAGMVLDIKVSGHPEFSGRYTVSDRGTIDYPLLAGEPVVNSSTAELMNELTFRLARHIENPHVLIGIVDKPEIEVTVLGMVVNPGTVRVLEGASVQEVIRNAGGPVTDRADLARITIVPREKRGNAVVFNLDSFLVSGDIHDLPAVAAGGTVIVPARRKSSSVKVIGSVQKPGLFTLEERMNLFEVIYLAGGPGERADLSRVRRFTRLDNGTAAEEVIDLQTYIDKGRMDNIPDVMEGDVIIVYTKWFDWKTVLTVLNNTLLFIVTIQAFVGIFK